MLVTWLYARQRNTAATRGKRRWATPLPGVAGFSHELLPHRRRHLKCGQRGQKYQSFETLTQVEQSAMDFKSNASSPRAVGGRVAAATVRSATALLAVGDACWRKVDTVCKPAQCCGAMLYVVRRRAMATGLQRACGPRAATQPLHCLSRIIRSSIICRDRQNAGQG